LSSTFQVGAGGQGESSFSKPKACATYLTEIILFGGAVSRTGWKLERDGTNMHATTTPESAQFFKRLNPKSWQYKAWWWAAYNTE
jgi:hypothetical protein